MSRKSGSPQYESTRNCSSALCNIGPRQITGCSSGTKKPIDRHRTPWTTGGTRSVVDGHRSHRDPEHLRHGEAVDIGVEQPDLVAPGRQGDGQVHRHRRLAHAALARRDTDHPGARIPGP